MNEDVSFSQMMCIVIHFGCRIANGHCLNEFEYQCYEAACRHLKVVQDIKRMACEHWLKENDQAVEPKE